MKKITALLILFLLPLTGFSGASFAAPDFETVKQTASPQAEKALGFAEDRTFDDEVKGAPEGLPDSVQFLGQSPLAPAPAGILLNTSIGERVVGSLADDRLSFFNKYRPQFSSSLEAVTEKIETDFTNAFFGNTDPSHVAALINTLDSAFEAGDGVEVWNQPLRMFREFEQSVSGILSSYLGALRKAETAADVDAALDTALNALAPLAQTAQDSLDVFKSDLDTLLGKSIYSPLVTELSQIFSDGISGAQKVLELGFVEIGQTVSATACNAGDHDTASFFCLPEVGDEVGFTLERQREILGVILASPGDVLQHHLKNLFPQAGHALPFVFSDITWGDQFFETLEATADASSKWIDSQVLGFIDKWTGQIGLTPQETTASFIQAAQAFRDYEMKVRAIYDSFFDIVPWVDARGEFPDQKTILAAAAEAQKQLAEALDSFMVEISGVNAGIIAKAGPEYAKQWPSLEAELRKTMESLTEIYSVSITSFVDMWTETV